LDQCIRARHLVVRCLNLLDVKGLNRGDTVKSMAMSEAVKEIRCIFSLLREMGIPFKLPIMVRTDKVGMMFMDE
jgi:hypothetical protein